MAILERNRDNFEKKQKQKKEETLKIKKTEDLRQNLSADKIKEIFYANLIYFNNIENGKEISWRNDAFKKGGGFNDLKLRDCMIGEPFTEKQQDRVYELVKVIWLKHKLMDRFVDVVILPEVFLKIYQIYFDLTKSEAEKNVNNAEGNRETNSSVSSDEILF